MNTEDKQKMNKEFFEALALLEKEKGVPMDYLLEKIKAAIVIAVRRDNGPNSVVNMTIDPEKAKFKVFLPFPHKSQTSRSRVPGRAVGGSRHRAGTLLASKEVRLTGLIQTTALRDCLV